MAKALLTHRRYLAWKSSSFVEKSDCKRSPFATACWTGSSESCKLWLLAGVDCVLTEIRLSHVLVESVDGLDRARIREGEYIRAQTHNVSMLSM